MSLFASYADKAVAAVERNFAALGRSEQRLAEHDAMRPDGDDADALFAWKRERRDLEDRVESDREALTFSEEGAARAKAEAAEKAAAAEHAAMLKRQAASAKRFRSIPEKFAPLLAELEWAEAEVAAFAEYNAHRSNRLFISDPEQEVRQIPARTIPAEYRDEVVWERGDGSRPFQFRRDSSGEMVPIEMGYTRKVVQVCVRPERTEFATMPDRYADLLPVLRKALGK